VLSDPVGSIAFEVLQPGLFQSASESWEGIRCSTAGGRNLVSGVMGVSARCPVFMPELQDLWNLDKHSNQGRLGAGQGVNAEVSSPSLQG
jgi:hypothetical protein